MRPLRRSSVTLAALATATLTLSGCSDTNFSAQTNQQYQAAEGANVVGDVDVLNTLLVINPDGSATISAGLVNHEDDEDALTGITARTRSDDPVTLPVSVPGRDVPLASDELVTIGGLDDDAVFVVGSAPLGLYVDLTLSFENAADVEVGAPVVDRSEVYDDVALD